MRFLPIVVVAFSFVPFARAEVAARLPNSIFTWLEAKTMTGIHGSSLPFFDKDGVYVRPKAEIRAFRSAAVDALVEKVTAEIPDAKFAKLFANCYPNTIDTTTPSVSPTATGRRRVMRRFSTQRGSPRSTRFSRPSRPSSTRMAGRRPISSTATACRTAATGHP